MVRRKRLIISLITISVIAMVMALILCMQKPVTESVPTEKEDYQSLYTAELHKDSVAEVLVDMGRVPASFTSTADIRLTNYTDTPISLLDYKATCRCVWLDMTKESIAPGEYTDIRFYFDSRGEWGSIGNYINITTSAEGSEVALWMCAEVE